MSKNNTPLEVEECRTLVDWLDWNGILFSHIAQETFTRSWKQKAKNKAMGVRKGVPDYIIVIPAEKSKTGKAELVFIEMKRKSGGRVSESQKQWHEALGEARQNIHVSKGADMAIETLESYLK